MANDSSLTYLPPGWTEDMYKTATDQDYDALTEEVQAVMNRGAAETRIEARKWFDETNAKRIARGAAPLPYPDDIASEQVPQADVPVPAAENLTNLIRLGYLRIYQHSWEAFEKGFYELLDEGIAAVSAESGFSRLDEKVCMRIVSDDSLANQPPEGVAAAYRVCMEEDEPADGDDEDDWGDKLEPGLTTSMCLMIDEESIRSVVDRIVGPTPFVKAVDGTMGLSQSLEYEGTMKVAVTSLIPAFYAALLVYSPSDAASKVSADGIWRNVGLWDPDMEGRRASKPSEP